ncbi:hypothetical protein MnTg02_03058 [bacterium MnTg02]|nr:hypothetical protein MnTg02_03058 [bacterium MnTg02]
MSANVTSWHERACSRDNLLGFIDAKLSIKPMESAYWSWANATGVAVATVFHSERHQTDPDHQWALLSASLKSPTAKPAPTLWLVKKLDRPAPPRGPPLAKWDTIG